ncbi:tyrosine-protein phosphatase [Vagococcus zengguangii]|uniref:Tyrosine-protein phosphatase n=1 Tax=Vagococcus zengguangii TaxID=2571750 RepID=A0A4D7CYL7_9ENTE|nr:tyrosine-protein phosphatase [Vagococcus zengguangii]QCI86776.1 tyrosine-protein phosphatase [Vagococcus zengguangii]TLG80382.1 tyrosine-protein phosphatase [Vagococcus zengguangii]
MLPTLTNFRDIGGYRGLDNKKVKQALIYRSGEINHLSPEDHQSFQDEYHIETIFDFRSDSERDERPNENFDGVTTYAIDILKGMQRSVSLDDLKEEATQTRPDAFMLEAYRAFVTDPSARAGYKQFIETVATLDKPFIFHCFAGKDRTGFAAALILSLLGVSELDIYHDYLLTNLMRKKANNKMIETMAREGAPKEQLEMFQIMMEVKHEYLAESFAQIKQHYGTVEQYVLEGLDVSPELIAQIRAKYLED